MYLKNVREFNVYVLILLQVSEAAKGEFEKGTKVTNYEEAVSCLLNQMKQVCISADLFCACV